MRCSKHLVNIRRGRPITFWSFLTLSQLVFCLELAVPRLWRAPRERQADAAGHEHIRKGRPEHPGNFAGAPAAGGALVG